MKDEIIDVEFTGDLREFLERRTYSHILAIGIEPGELNDASEPESGVEKYWLEPMKADDPRLAYQDAEPVIYEINHADVVEMATSTGDVHYMIRVPVVDYDDFLKKR